MSPKAREYLIHNKNNESISKAKDFSINGYLSHIRSAHNELTASDSTREKEKYIYINIVIKYSFIKFDHQEISGYLEGKELRPGFQKILEDKYYSGHHMLVVIS